MSSIAFLILSSSNCWQADAPLSVSGRDASIRCSMSHSTAQHIRGKQGTSVSDPDPKAWRTKRPKFACETRMETSYALAACFVVLNRSETTCHSCI